MQGDINEEDIIEMEITIKADDDDDTDSLDAQLRRSMINVLEIADRTNDYLFEEIKRKYQMSCWIDKTFLLTVDEDYLKDMTRNGRGTVQGYFEYTFRPNDEELNEYFNNKTFTLSQAKELLNILN